MPQLPFGPWRPDTPQHENMGALEALNVIPTQGAQEGQIAYRPMKGLTTYSAALGSRALGAIGITQTDGTTYVFAGTQTGLYMLSAGSTSWTEVGTNFNSGAEGRWNFTKFGNTVIATNGIDPLQAFQLGTSSAFTQLSTSAPRARYVATVKNFLMVGDTEDDTDGSQPQRVWWPAIEDPGTWPAVGSNAAIQVQSDFQNLFGDGGRVQGLVSGLAATDCLIMMERQLWRADYQGGRVVFSFDQIEGARGTPAPGSVVQYGGRGYYLGDDGFYMTDGATSSPIGDGKIDRWFFDRCDASAFDRISSAIDPSGKFMLVAFPGPGASSSNPNELLIFNLTIGEWAHATAYEVEMLVNTSTFGLTVDSVDAVYPGGVDALSMSVDSRIFAGGRNIMSAFDTSHQLAYFTGPNVAATIDTTEGNLTGNQRGALCNGVWPEVDGGTITVQVGTRDRVQDSVVFGAENAVNDIGFAPARQRGRYHRARVNIAAAGEWNHAQGINFEVVGSGRRA